MLGYLVGREVGQSIPYFRGLDIEPYGDIVPPRDDTRLRALGAAMAASGAVALYHVEDVTPEAREGGLVSVETCMLIDGLEEGYTALNTTPLDAIDLVSVGCPHASTDDIREIAGRVRGRKLMTKLWVTDARATKQRVPEATADIEAAGGSRRGGYLPGGRAHRGSGHPPAGDQLGQSGVLCARTLPCRSAFRHAGTVPGSSRDGQVARDKGTRKPPMTPLDLSPSW